MDSAYAKQIIDKAISELNTAKTLIDQGRWEDAGDTLFEAHTDVEEVTDEHEEIRLALFGESEKV